MVALVFWIAMANAQHDKEWYDEQIQKAIQGVKPQEDLSFISGFSDRLPHSTSPFWRNVACSVTSYKHSSLNAMVVGHVVGELDKHLRNDIARKQIYTTFCIGLSLGAHVCGFIGKSSKTVYPIITSTHTK